jgi:hypothetical protein
VVLPYELPSSGNTIISNNNGGTQEGSTDPNSLSGGTSPDGIYWNSIDFNGRDRTDYFSSFTGQSVTLTISQNGITAVYSGNTGVDPDWTFNTWSNPSMGNGFYFRNGGDTEPNNKVTLINEARSGWVTGDTVYISAVINRR